jgi:hypothetical protein
MEQRQPLAPDHIFWRALPAICYLYQHKLTITENITIEVLRLLTPLQIHAELDSEVKHDDVDAGANNQDEYVSDDYVDLSQCHPGVGPDHDFDIFDSVPVLNRSLPQRPRSLDRFRSPSRSSGRRCIARR